ncbi:transthyretin [Ambystoma mexicanum]|uniref:transthyretin n=1 Tax=Ambystoma mexicanum TaxID=8296 RepID=UPI0037E74648
MASTSMLVILAALVLCEAAPPALDSLGTNDDKSPLSVKMLDAIQGVPAANVAVEVFKRAENGTWKSIASGKTTESGEILNLTNEEDFVEGTYKVEFCTKPYWRKLGITPFHENAVAIFKANNAGRRHYTIAALISPFSQTISAAVSAPLD